MSFRGLLLWFASGSLGSVGQVRRRSASGAQGSVVPWDSDLPGEVLASETFHGNA